MSEQIKKDINIAIKDMKKGSNFLNKASSYLDRDNPLLISAELKKYEKLMEKVVNEARLMPLTLGLQNDLEDIQENIKDFADIKIKRTEKYFYIKMPVLLNKKESGNPSYIRSTLFYALRDYFSTHHEEKIKEKCVIVFKHNYSKKRPYREMRDHDNIELNSVVDLVTMFMLNDDNPLLLDHYYFSTNIMNEDNTEIFLIPKKYFKECLIEGVLES